MAKSTDVRPKSLARIKTEAQAKKFIEQRLKEIKEQVGDGKVLLALSGGVDSSVLAALLAKAIFSPLYSIRFESLAFISPEFQTILPKSLSLQTVILYDTCFPFAIHEKRGF